MGPLSRRAFLVLGVLVVAKSGLVAEVGDAIRVLWDDENEEGDNYFVHCILDLGNEPGERPRVAVYFSDDSRT